MNPINTTPISQFVQLIRSAEQQKLKEIRIPIQQAYAINLALVEVLDKLNQDYESMFNKIKGSSETDTTISVSMDGGGFGTS